MTARKTSPRSTPRWSAPWSWSGRAEAPLAPAPIKAGCEDIQLEGSGTAAVLLLHGFGDTPQTFCYLAPALHAAGLTVSAPLLPGHGRTVEHFARSSADQWIDTARTSLRSLTERYTSVGVCGLSMGASLATILAAEESRVRALALIAPYVAMPGWLAALSVLHRAWGPFFGPFGSGSDLSIRDPVERARNLGYGATTAKLLHELWAITRAAQRAIPRVTAPTLVLQSREDNRVAPRVSERVVARLGSTQKKLVFTTGAGHIVTVDHGRDTVIAEVREWLLAHLGDDR